mmetsp:Transcript_60518/g.72761  ORF Transcript_60518/g.72761 Transcript_60518/m.72761 type:complete len:641 (+) Transcript_60518:49-1971(+)
MRKRKNIVKYWRFLIFLAIAQIPSVFYLFLQEESLEYSSLPSIEESVFYFDETAMENVLATFAGAYSWTQMIEAGHASANKFQTEPLHATVDRRPLTASRQIKLDKSGLHENGQLLGCALSASTFVSHLENLKFEINKKGFDVKNMRPVSCDVCFQFSNQEDMAAFIPGIKHNPIVKNKILSASTKCVRGKGTLNAKFAGWQKALRVKEGFVGYGYPWIVDCTLPNGILDLTCREISKLNDKISSSDALQKIYLQTKITLDSMFNETETNIEKSFDVFTSWPWAALRSHDDDRSRFASQLPQSWNDTSSMFVPSSAKKLKMAHVIGPVYKLGKFEGKMSLQSMDHNPDSDGGVHFRFLADLFHLIRNAPNSVHITAVVDGQAQRTREVLVDLLNTSIDLIYPKYGEAMFGDPAMLQKREYIPFYTTTKLLSLPEGQKLTLRDVLRLRGIKIHLVPLITPPSLMEQTVCAGQYSFTSFLATRFSADYQVMMYVDGDTALVENHSLTLQEVMYNRFFSENSNKCAGHRLQLIEQYVRPEDETIDRVLQCTKKLMNDPKRWKYVTENCNLREGHISARTDSINLFSVHHPDTQEEFAPAGVQDCITPSNVDDPKYFLTADEGIQVHLRRGERKKGCSCFSETT